MADAAAELEVSERDLFAPPRTSRPSVRPSLPRSLPRPPPRPRVARLHDALRGALVLESERGILALLVPVAMGAGAIGYFSLPAEPAWSQLLLGLTALLIIRHMLRERPRGALVLAGAIWVLTGVVAAKFETWRADTRVLGGEISTRVTGRVVDIDHLANGRVRIVLDILATERPKLRYAPQRVRVSAASLPSGVRSGSVIGGFVRLHPPSGPIRPGSYDFAFESYFDGIGANGFFLGAPKLASATEIAPLGIRLRAMSDNARNAVAERVRTTIGGAEGEIAAALIVGVRAGIPEPVNESLRRTGLAHILSISGLHMALVAVSVMMTLRLGMALVPGFVARYPAKKYAAIVALGVISAYLFISGGEVAAQRSFIMLAVMLVAVLFDRQALTMRNLAISAMIVLFVSPHEIMGPSFQMSFAATAALIGAYAWWAGRRRETSPPVAPQAGASTWRRGARWIWLMIAGTAGTAIVAGLATSIYGVWHFQRVSIFTLFANLAVTPIVSFVIMPSGLLASLAMPFGLDGPFLWLMGKGLSAMLAVSDYLSARSPVDAVGTVPGMSVALVTVALLVATLTTTRLRLLALPFMAGGIAMLPVQQSLDMFVSEDAKLVGVHSERGELLVNRRRPNKFTAQGWQRAMTASAIVTSVVDRFEPDASEADDISPGNQGEDPGGTTGEQRLSYAEAQQMTVDATARSFTCKGPLCVVLAADRRIVAVAANAWTAQQVCEISDIVVVQDPRARPACVDGRRNILTARALAQRGAAEIRFSRMPQPVGAETEIKITYSISTPYRPWHEHRQFSRAARGMPPYQLQQRRRPAAAANDAGAQTPDAQ